MKKLLRVLSVLVLFLPNLTFVCFVLLGMMAEAGHTNPADTGQAEFMRIMTMTGLAVFGATVLGMIVGRRIVRVPLAWAFVVVAVLFFFGIVGEGADGKAALAGLGVVLAAVLATVICMAVARLLAWAAAKLPEKR